VAPRTELTFHRAIARALWRPAVPGSLAARTEDLFKRRHRLPAQRSEEPDGGLLDELVLGVGVRTHGRKLRQVVMASSTFSGSSRPGQICWAMTDQVAQPR
jgi:hypothetical protein